MVFSHFNDVSTGSVDFGLEGQLALVTYSSHISSSKLLSWQSSHTIVWLVCWRGFRYRGGVLRRGLLVEGAHVRPQTLLHILLLVVAPHLLPDPVVFVKEQNGEDEDTGTDHDQWPKEGGKNDEEDGE